MAKTRKIKNESIAFKLTIWTALILLLAVMLLPFLVLINTALKSNVDFLNNPISIAPLRPIGEMFSNFVEAVRVLDVANRLLYTVVLTISSTIISCLIIVLAAFPLARGHFKSYNKVFIFIIASQFFPGSLVANIFLVQKLYLYNNPLVLVLFWGLGGLSVHIFMVIQFIRSLPVELDESAFMDGCGYFKYIFSFVIPLSKPILTTVFVLRLVGAWNDFLTPYVYMVDQKFMTISTGLYSFKGQFNNNWPGMAAATLTVAFPVIILYAIMQRYIIEGVTTGALKG